MSCSVRRYQNRNRISASLRSRAIGAEVRVDVDRQKVAIPSWCSAQDKALSQRSNACGLKVKSAIDS